MSSVALNRREVIAGGVCIATLPPLAMLGAANPKDGPRRIYGVVEGQSRECMSFGHALREAQMAVHTIPAASASALEALWFGTLRPRMAAAPLTIVGLTAPATLFVLEQLCSEYWHRVSAAVEHVIGGASEMGHPGASLRRLLARQAAAAPVRTGAGLAPAAGSPHRFVSWAIEHTRASGG